MNAQQATRRVALIADDPLARAGIGALLAMEPGITVVAEAKGPGELPSNSAEVVLWDMGAGERSAAEASSGALEAIDVPVVALVSNDGAASSAAVLGARGVLRRQAEPSLVRAAIYAASEGLVVLDPSLARVLFGGGRSTASLRNNNNDELTAREGDVLQLLAEGLANKEIASRLGISDHTVKFHVNAIMAKLSVQSRTEAVVRAARLGLLLL